MSPKLQRLSTLCLALLSIPLLLISCHHLNNQRAEENFRQTLQMDPGPITPERTTIALQKRIPFGTERQRVETLLLNDHFLRKHSGGKSSSEEFTTMLDCGTTTLWPPSRRMFRVTFTFHPTDNTLQSIRSEDHWIYP